ncbi:hypothetical protein AK830_g11746 [Neonectria ditissima]|uniref:BZIP domain-containing protein n=1 Tax=Neonectria ditissima TaxID=78410 RepID=A0A0P7B767_9HYPO|nr:hypothetical protein AK830_g11746 [Neonectria ditissima]
MGFPADGVLLTKWSSKPADHKIVRVRNNQRRHRERVKSRIADLESRLAETQLELQRALSTIERLTAEPGHAACHRSTIAPGDADRNTPLLGCASSTTTTETWSVDEESCCDLNPPGPEESTTRCRDAYKIIAEQNYAGLDAFTLREWLQPGFRGASAKDDGCRVENGLLFSLLDHISSS